MHPNVSKFSKKLSETPADILNNTSFNSVRHLTQ